MVVARAARLRWDSRGMFEGFTKRVGCANMQHDIVAKRDLSWAWMGATRAQARYGMSLVALLGWGGPGHDARKHPGGSIEKNTDVVAHVEGDPVVFVCDC